MKKKSTIDELKWWKKIKDHRSIRIILMLILGVFMYFLMLANVIPEKLEIKLSQVAETDIRSPVTVENKAATEQKRKEALNSVQPVYVQKKEYAHLQVEKVNDIFHIISQANQEFSEQKTEEDGSSLLEKKLAYVKEAISSGSSDELSDQTLITLINANDYQLQMAREATTNAVHDVMNQKIAISDLKKAKEEVKTKIAISTVPSQLHEAMIEIAQFAIIPNYIYDDQATERLQQQAVEAVEPVIIREGQLLVKAGETINHEIYEQLRLVGLLDDSNNIYSYIGLFILVSLIIAVLYHNLNETRTSLKTNNTHLLMYVAIFLVVIVLMKISSLLERLDILAIGYIVPAAVGSMLITMLIHPRIAAFSSIFFAVIASIIFNNGVAGTFNFSFGVYVLFHCFAGVYFLGKTYKVSKILRNGLLIGAVNVIVILCLLFLRGSQLSWLELGYHLSFAVLSGFIAAVLTLGLLPFFEAVFGILSTNKLIELSNPNHPLLRKILLEAPGTYHHSVLVGNLAEAACEAIGANGLLARVGAYYHDLGKTKRPHFFIENQMKMENPHDKISPQLSKTIIIAHTTDGTEMLREYKMPKEIIDICEQHHGTTLLKYFYHKACQESDQPIPEEQFRYPGPKPQTKEAAVVGIADSVEAAVRSLQKPTPEKIEQMVRKIITDRLEDGQFDECDLTLKELDKIAVSICETLNGTFHSRIEYPEDVKKELKK